MGTGILRFLKPSAFKLLGFLVRPFDLALVDPQKFSPDFDTMDIEIIQAVRPYTMTSPERLYALIHAVRYIVENKIPGDMVECGVWKGGSMMAVAKMLLYLGDAGRHLFLFDTFEGMSKPTELDVDWKGGKAPAFFERWKNKLGGSSWCYASLSDVKQAMYSVGYPIENLHFVQGRVEDTIPARTPESISLLRLDTDWYESTRHELVQLFPRLSRGGVIIIDDYGHWQGARLAVDEWIAHNKMALLLNRIDYSGRVGVNT
jgi:O-methyltransferase